MTILHLSLRSLLSGEILEGNNFDNQNVFDDFLKSLKENKARFRSSMDTEKEDFATNLILEFSSSPNDLFSFVSSGGSLYPGELGNDPFKEVSPSFMQEARRIVDRMYDQI
jgi:hypothetical protein